jgi:hypothetical protein
VARIELDREDLMRDAAALRQRVELLVDGFSEPVFAGFKSNGSLSVYIGQDPVYQFDRDGRLRRAYAAGLLYRTQGTTLATLRRERTETETVLVRRDLSVAQCEAFLAEMRDTLGSLLESLQSGRFTVQAMIPETGGVLFELKESLVSILANSEAGLAPRIKR